MPITRVGLTGPIAAYVEADKSPAVEAAATIIVNVQFTPGVWTDITDDVLTEYAIRLRYGIDGNGPTDCVASTGECGFSLNNSHTNTGTTEGWYSPVHANKRAGWAVGIPLRISLEHSGTVYVKFFGKVGVIDPDAGQYRSRAVHVVGYDYMRDLMKADVRNLEIQLNQTEADLVQAAYNALPPAAQPPNTNIDAGFETFPYAFHDLGDGTKAAQVFRDIAISGLGLFYISGNGTLTFRNRQSRAAVTSALTLGDDEMRELDVTSSSDMAFNRARVTIPNLFVGPDPVVVYGATGAIPPINPGEIREIWGAYFDPNDFTRPIGAHNLIAPVAGTDYAGDALPDGSGSDLTADLTVTITEFASNVLFTIENTGAQDVYLVNNDGETLLRVRGTPIYINGQQTYEYFEDDGESPIDVLMPYQASGTTAQGLAQYIVGQYNQADQIDSVSFEATKSSTLLLHALSREPGDCVTLSEAITGLAAVNVVIQSIELEVMQGQDDLIIFCNWGVALALSATVPPPPPPPADPGDLVVSYTGPVSGTQNLTDGALALTIPGQYFFNFSRIGLDIRVKGVAAGGTGATASATGGDGGGSGASHLTGVVVSLTQANYAGQVGSPIAPTIDVGDTIFRESPGVTRLSLGSGGDGPGGVAGLAGVGGGVDGEGGGTGADPNTDSPALPGGSGVTGGGGGGASVEDVIGADGGDGTDQTGGIGTNGVGGSPSPDQVHDAVGGNPGTDSGVLFVGGGGAGGGVLLAGIYAGGGGGGGGMQTSVGGAPGAGGRGGQGVLVIALEP